MTEKEKTERKEWLSEGLSLDEIREIRETRRRCAKYGHTDFEYWGDGIAGCRDCLYTEDGW